MGRHYWIDELAEAFNFGDHGFSRLEPALRRAAESDASRRAGADDVAWLERSDGRDVRNQLGRFEDELTRVGVLQDFAADGELDVEAVRVGNFVCGDNGRSDGAKGVEALAQRPLRCGQLDVSRTDVVEDGVAEDVL